MAEARLENQRSEREAQRSRSTALTPTGEREGWINPFTLMRRLSDEMDRAFATSFGLPTWGRTSVEEEVTWIPPVEVREIDNRLVVQAELPGMNKEDVKVEITAEGLCLQGERRREHEEKGPGYYRTERSYGHFCRMVPLPEGIDPDKAKAEFKNGVLQVEFPLPESLLRKRKEIPIKN